MPSGAVLNSLFLLFLSEAADKTMLLILGLALQYKARIQVFFGALSAHALMDLLAIILGAVFGVSLPAGIVKPLIALLFVSLGFWQLYKLFLRKARKHKKKIAFKANPFLTTFSFVAVSEFGDKSQILSGLLGAQYAQIASVFLGVLLGLSLAIGLNVFVARKIAEKLPRKTIKTAAAVLFIVFGIATMLF